MEFIFNNFWIMFIVVTFLNAFILKKQTKKYIIEKPEREEGYNKLFKGFLILGNIPWIIMGIGILTGNVENMFMYFCVKCPGIYIKMFYTSVILIWLFGIIWVLFKDGAQFLENHPGFFRMKGFGTTQNLTAKQIRIIFILFAVFGTIGFTMFFFFNPYQF